MPVWFLALWSALALGAEPEMIPLESLEVVGHAAPGFRLPLRDGGTFDLASNKGKVVVMSFWASWCGPCRAELPELAKYAKAHPDVVFVAVNVDRERVDAEKFLKQIGGLELPIAWDSAGQALGDYSVMSMPTSFVVDPKGRVVKKKVGFSRERGLTEIDQAVKEASQ